MTQPWHILDTADTGWKPAAKGKGKGIGKVWSDAVEMEGMAWPSPHFIVAKHIEHVFWKLKSSTNQGMYKYSCAQLTS